MSASPSLRLQSVKPSPTLLLTQKAKELKAQGKDILSLTAGEPDFPTPPWICEAAVEAVRRGENRYTAVGGTPALKEAIVEKFKRDNGLSYVPSEILVSNGGKQVIFNAFLSTLNPGDEVVIPAPYWVSYPDMVYVAEGKPVLVSCPISQKYKITPDQLKSALTERTKWVVLNSPSNPTGVMYTREELLALGDVLRDFPHVLILSDDIYEHILYDGHSFHTLAEVCPDLKERILIVNGVSKSYSMTGWRIGFGAGPKWMIDAMTDLQSHSTSNPCSIAQAAALAAITGPQEFLKEWVKSFKERRDRALEILSEIPGLKCPTPEGAFYLYFDLADIVNARTPSGVMLKTDEEVATYLLEEKGVALVPGSAFGQSPCLRLSFATDLKTLEMACERIRDAFSALLK